MKVFRGIRAEMLSGNRINEYIIYALGEIVLVVAGILIALAVDDWNESRKNGQEFRANLNQIHTTIDQDISVLLRVQYSMEKQIALIDSVLRNPKSISPAILPHVLYYVDINPERITSEVSYELEHAIFDPGDLKQTALHKGLMSYANAIDEFKMVDLNHVTPFLVDQKLSYPSLQFDVSDLNNFAMVDKNLFSPDEIAAALSLLENPIFRRALKSAKSGKQLNLLFLQHIIEFAQEKKAEIREYYPEVILLYKNIGFVGDASSVGNWEQNVELSPTDNMRSIWEADVVLKDGYIKFRAGNDWLTNWGGNSFPEGTLIFNGDNIKVKAGRYHMVVNLTKRTYQFSNR